MRYLVRFWLPLLVLATLDSSTLSTLGVYGQEEEEAAAAEQVKAEVIVEDVVVDVAAAVEAEAQVLVEEAAAAVKTAKGEEKVASQRLEKEIDSKNEEAVESALSSLKEKVSAVMNTVKNKSNLVVDKIKNVSPSDAKKIAAGVLGVWGVSVGAGWVAQNINKNNVAPPVFEEKVGRRK
jgi:sorbitol-specific phosphotransferase system component IIBC